MHYHNLFFLLQSSNMSKVWFELITIFLKYLFFYVSFFRACQKFDLNSLQFKKLQALQFIIVLSYKHCNLRYADTHKATTLLTGVKSCLGFSKPPIAALAEEAVKSITAKKSPLRNLGQNIKEKGSRTKILLLSMFWARFLASPN